MKFRIQLFLIISRNDQRINENHFRLVQLIRIKEKSHQPSGEGFALPPTPFPGPSTLRAAAR